MLIVDSQIHIWENETMNANHRQVRTFSARDALAEMAAAGVDAALIHPPSSLPNTNATAIAAAKAHPDKFAILGHFAVEKPENRGLVAAWKQQPGMLGFRFTFMQPNQRSWWTDGTLDWLWAAAEKAGTPIGLLAGGHFDALATIAERHPGLHLLIDHLGRAGGAKDEAAFADLPQMLALARFPNVAVKVSGAPSYSSESYPWPNVHTQIRRIFDAFGPARTFWGTDITRLSCTYRECVTMFTEEMPWLKGRDLELVMGRALCDWIGWDLKG
jgi:predicted TIM-barrel fold metal-dependent hydrolase